MWTSAIIASSATVVIKIVETVTGWKTLQRHVGYLFHYKKNVKKLEAKMKDLGNQRGKIEREVEEAKTLGQIIEDDVLNWLNEADQTKEDIEAFMESKVVKENVQCFKCLCPDFIWRYHLNKQAKKQTIGIKALVEKSNFQRFSHSAPPPPELQFLSCEHYETFDSRTSVFKAIMEGLKDSNVNVIGIYGPGGVGKTTTAEEVSKKVQKDGLFDEVVMAVVSQNVNVSQIQDKLADRLRIKLKAVTEVGKAGELWNRLKNGKKNLVIIDDIWQKVELKTIGIPITDGTNACKVVLTSRSQDVCQSMEVDKAFEIQILSKPEAWELFKKQVGNSFDSRKMESVTKEVCEECGGLPVAILAVGAALNCKREHAWDYALDKLRKSKLRSIKGVEAKVYRSLKFSYDFIEPIEAKSWFLLCSLFPEDAQIPIDELVRYGIGMGWLENEDTLEKARNTVLTLADTLKDSCLLLNGRNEEFVKMHDVTRDVAIEIARDEKAFLVEHGLKEWPKQGMLECFPAISLRFENVYGEIPEDLIFPQLQTLLLECDRPYYDEQLKVPNRFFSGIQKLRVLRLYGTCMSPIPSSLAELVDLRMLSLQSWKLGDMAILKHLKTNLEILNLQGFDIDELPLEIGQLTHLRVLDLQDCDDLKIIPPGVISNLSCLEELFIPQSFDNWEATTANEERTNTSLGELKSLTRLTTLHIHIPDVMLLPNGLCFDKFTRFAISVGDTFSYAEISSSTTRILKLHNIPIRDEFNTLLERAEGLYLSRVENLKVLYDKVGEGPFTLKCLKVSNCKDLKYLFSPSCARRLQKLERLEITSCEAMEGIVGIEGERDEEEITSKVHFSQLKCMRLDCLPNLTSFYPKMEKTTEEENSSIHAQPLFNEKVALPALEEFKIKDVANITAIWGKKAESFYQLKVMEVWSCEKLENVVRSLAPPMLHNLKEKEAASDDVIAFPQLKTLEFLHLGNLKSFCNDFERSEGQPLFNNQVAFPALDNLDIEWLPNITKIWNEKLPPADSFYQLRNVKVTECDKLENLAPSIMLPSLQNLKEVDISDCPNMEVIVTLEKAKEKEATGDDLITFSQLRTLRLYNLENFKYFCDNFRRLEGQSLFDHQVAFPKLEQVSLNEINLLHILADHIGKLRNLRIEGSDNGTSVFLPNLLHRFGHLEKLRVIKCCSVTEIFDLDLNVEGGDVDHRPLSRLRLLDLYLLPELSCLWNKNLYGILSFQSLEVVKIMKCDLLRNLFSSSVASALKQLQYLLVKSCELVEEIIADERGDEPVANIAFPQLKYLGLINLPNLKSFCSANYAFSMPSLKVVGLDRCFEMQTFVTGELSMPKTKICESFVYGRWTWSMDLNKHVQRRQISRGKTSESVACKKWIWSTKLNKNGPRYISSVKGFKIDDKNDEDDNEEVVDREELDYFDLVDDSINFRPEDFEIL